MTVIEQPRPKVKEKVLRDQIAALQPGECFSIDRPITVEEFCDYVSDEWGAELVNGVVFVLCPTTDPHAALSVWLTALLGTFVENRGLGEVRGGRSGVRISGTSLREPDFLFFSKARLGKMTQRGVHGAPDLAIEIVDSAAARRDAVQKQAQYEQIGVAELWVIDLPRAEIRQFVLEDGRYLRLPPEATGEVTARTVGGFHLKAEWCFQGPSFPNSLDVVQNLLAEPRG